MKYEIKKYFYSDTKDGLTYLMVGIFDEVDLQKKFTGVVISDAGKNPYQQEYYLKGNPLMWEDEDADDDVRETIIEDEFPGLMEEIFSVIYEYLDFDEEECCYIPKENLISLLNEVSEDGGGFFYKDEIKIPLETSTFSL